MNHDVTTILAVLKTFTLLIGSLITYYAFKAYRRTHSPALRALAAGFGIVTAGSLFAGITDRLLPLDPIVALVVESLFTTVGFAVILYSLYAE